MKNNDSVKSSGACPTYFRALCANEDYKHAGRQLAAGIGSEGDEFTTDEWAARVKELDEAARVPLMHEPNVEAIVEWFERNLPRCIALVPEEHRESFAEGVAAYRSEEGIAV